jgi:hypothetical protein
LPTWTTDVWRSCPIAVERLSAAWRVGSNASLRMPVNVSRTF